MAEYETYVELEGEINVDVYFEGYSLKDKLKIIGQILLGKRVTFEETFVELGGDTYVEIEPQDKY